MAMVVYRIGLFVVATFAFVTLYDFGPANFATSASTELSVLTTWLQSLSGR
jgi:hypothetical protein